MAKFSELSRYAQADLQQLIAYLIEHQLADTAKLRRAVEADSPVLNKHLQITLEAADWSSADAYTKRLVAQLLSYVPGEGAHLNGIYARERQAEASREANSMAGRSSFVTRVNVASEYAERIDAMTPQQRGEALTAWLDAQGQTA